MLYAIGPAIWHRQYGFASMRMTVVRMADGTLWLHAPVPISRTRGRAWPRWAWG